MSTAASTPECVCGWCHACEKAMLRHAVAQLALLVREALSKGPERRCPWCWTVASKGNHASDCRAIAVLTAEAHLIRALDVSTMSPQPSPSPAVVRKRKKPKRRSGT